MEFEGCSLDFTDEKDNLHRYQVSYGNNFDDSIDYLYDIIQTQMCDLDYPLSGNLGTRVLKEIREMKRQRKKFKDLESYSSFVVVPKKNDGSEQ